MQPDSRLVLPVPTALTEPVLWFHFVQDLRHFESSLTTLVCTVPCEECGVHTGSRDMQHTHLSPNLYGLCRTRRARRSQRPRRRT